MALAFESWHLSGAISIIHVAADTTGHTYPSAEAGAFVDAAANAIRAKLTSGKRKFGLMPYRRARAAGVPEKLVSFGDAVWEVTGQSVIHMNMSDHRRTTVRI